MLNLHYDDYTIAPVAVKHSGIIYRNLIMSGLGKPFAVFALYGAILSACSDRIEAPRPEELEQSDTVQFDVRNVTDGWKPSRAAESNNPADWTDLPRMDEENKVYPDMFIQKDVYYPPHRPTIEPYTNNLGYEEGKGGGIFRPQTSGVTLDVESSSPAYSDSYARLRINVDEMTDRVLGELSSHTPAVRSTVVDDSNLAEKYAQMGVTAVCFDGNLGFGYAPDRVRTMDNELVQREGNRWKTTRTNYYWNVWGKDYNRVRFFAYAPWGAAGLTMIDDDTDGTPRFHYDVPADVDDQTDLSAIAVTTPGNFQRTVPLRLDHVLTGVRFLVDDEHMAGCLKKVTLRGIHGSGNYKYTTSPYDFTDPDDTSNPNINPDNNPDKPGVTPSGQTVTKGTWTPTDNPTAEYLLTEDDFFSPPVRSPLSVDDEFWQVTDIDRMFMLLPQQLPETAEIEAVFEDEGEEIIMRGKIGGKDEDGNQRLWEQGTIVTYVITTYDVEYVLKLVKEGGAYPYPGGTDNKTVVSYARYYDKSGNLRKIVPVEWTPIFYDINGNEVEAPDWYRVQYDREPARAKDYRPDGTNDATFAAEFSRLHEDSVCHGHVIVDAQTALMNNENTRKLREAPFIGTEENPVNLAGVWAGDPASTISTSNCYIINNPGYYNIPLVYGNAVKDGAVNDQAYYSVPSAFKDGPTFQTHLGNAITSPYIKNCGAVIKDAAYMTSTALNCVQLVHLTDDYLTVYVDPQYIDQANTVVVVRDTQGDVMWSWHLWTTDNDPYDGDTRRVPTSNGENFDFMTVNLGWHSREGDGLCAARAAYWKPAQNRRKSKYQSDGHEEESGVYTTPNRYRIFQDGFTMSPSGFAPTYNWGRKDPLMKIVHGEFGSEILQHKYLYDNTALTTRNKDNSRTYSLANGYYFVKQFTPGESVKVPWAIPTFMDLSYEMKDGTAQLNQGSTTNQDYCSWWTGNRDAILRPGPVPLPHDDWCNSLVWPNPRNPNGDRGGNDDYTRYDDLWCIGQDRLGYLSHEQGDRTPVKTVYDPCPPGFMVPPNRAFDKIFMLGVFRVGWYRHPAYDLDFPAMPFLSARAGFSIVGSEGNLYIANQYGVVFPESPDGTVQNYDTFRGYVYLCPFNNSLFGYTMTLWTSDLSYTVKGLKRIIFGSFYNVTGSYTVNPIPPLAANGNSNQMITTDPRHASTGLGWSANGRQIRAVREK